MIGGIGEAASYAAVAIQFKFLATRTTRYVFVWINKDIAGKVTGVLLEGVRVS